MTDSSDCQWWKVTCDWAWDNKEWLAAKLGSLRQYLFRRGPGAVVGPRCLIIGAGGVGKTTTGHLLQGDYDDALNIPGQYRESVYLDTFSLKDDPATKISVPPGQQFRRDATWSGIQSSIANGEYCGVIIVNAYGYHSIGNFSYRNHRLYEDDVSSFVQAYASECRQEEIRVVKRIAPFIRASPNKIWIINLVTKEDLWWSDRQSVHRHYGEGPYGNAIREAISGSDASRLHVETVFASLVIANFVTGESEVLASTCSGYESTRRVESVKTLWKTIYAVKQWGES